MSRHPLHHTRRMPMPDHEGRTTVEKLEMIRGLLDELEGLRRDRDAKVRLLLREATQLLKEP
jgi:hypothetical protein